MMSFQTRNADSFRGIQNFTSVAVLDALGSVMQNKYSEGYPGARCAHPFAPCVVDSHRAVVQILWR